MLLVNTYIKTSDWPTIVVAAVFFVSNRFNDEKLDQLEWMNEWIKSFLKEKKDEDRIKNDAEMKITENAKWNAVEKYEKKIE